MPCEPGWRPGRPSGSDLDLVLSFDEFSPIVELDRHYATEAKYSAPAE